MLPDEIRSGTVVCRPEVGDWVKLIVSMRPESGDRRLMVTTWTRAEIVELSADRVTVRLVDFPHLRLRSVKRISWRLAW